MRFMLLNCLWFFNHTFDVIIRARDNWKSKTTNIWNFINNFLTTIQLYRYYASNKFIPNITKIGFKLYSYDSFLKFKLIFLQVQYSQNQACHMSKVRDFPPVSGSIIWARQVSEILVFKSINWMVKNLLVHNFIYSKPSVSRLHWGNSEIWGLAKLAAETNFYLGRHD